MKNWYVIKCDRQYIKYDQYKNMQHKFKYAANINDSTEFINIEAVMDCVKYMTAYFEFKNLEVIEFKSILRVNK